MIKRGLGIIFCGTEGMGKTSLGSKFAKPMSFISIRETGYLDLQAVNAVDVEGVSHFEFDNYETLKKYILNCEDKTIVIDSLFGFEQILHQHLIDVVPQFEKSASKFYAFSTGPRQFVPREMVNFESILNIKRAKGTNIILLAHAKVIKAVNPQGADYLTYTLQLDEALTSCFLKWSQATIFINQEVNINVATDKAGGVILEGKSLDNTARLMYTTKSMTHTAKNRMGLPKFISMGESADQAYANFWKHVPESFK